MGKCSISGKPSQTDPGPLCGGKHSGGAVTSHQFSSAAGENSQSVKNEAQKAVKKIAEAMMTDGEVDRIAFEKMFEKMDIEEAKRKKREKERIRDERIKAVKKGTRIAARIAGRFGIGFLKALMRAFKIPPFRGHKLVKKWLDTGEKKNVFARELALSKSAKDYHHDLSTHPDQRVRANYYRTNKVSHTELANVIKDGNTMVKAAAFKNPYLTADQVEFLYQSGGLTKNEEKLLIINPSCPNTLRMKAMKDNLYGIRDGIGYVNDSFNDREFDLIVQHASKDAVDRLLKKNGHLSSTQRKRLREKIGQI